jgi:hypothetical protein
MDASLAIHPAEHVEHALFRRRDAAADSTKHQQALVAHRSPA